MKKRLFYDIVRLAPELRKTATANSDLCMGSAHLSLKSEYVRLRLHAGKQILS